MPHAGRRALHRVIFGSGIAAAIGFVLVVYGSFLPPFRDEVAAMQAFANWCADDGRASAIAGERFESFKTARYPLMNAGIWLALVGISTGLLAALLFRTPAPNGSWLRTPASRWAFFPAGLGVLATTWAGMVVGIQLDQQRYAFPACADSIIIGLTYLTAGSLLFAVVLTAVGLLVSIAFGRLPVSLLFWDREKPVRSWTVTLVIGMAMLAGTVLAVISSTSADFLTAPAVVASLYLLAASRAALLAPKS